jgi:hypothetical protein
MSEEIASADSLLREIANLRRALALAEGEMLRLRYENAAQRDALDQAVGALLMERAVSERARVYIMYTSGAYPGDEQQIDLLTKWLEACKRRKEGAG